MYSSFRVAWQQLTHQPMKLATASAGVVVAVMLMLVQLGIRQGAIDNGVAIAERITADLVVSSPRTKSIFLASTFPRRLLYRLPAHPDVEKVQVLYISEARFRNPWDRREIPISVYGLDPRDPMMNMPGYTSLSEELDRPDCLIFDELSRSSYGPVVEYLKNEGPLYTEVNYRRIAVLDSIPVGISFTSDGNIYTSPANFQRLFPTHDPGAINLGLVRLKPGADPQKVCRELAPMLGNEAYIKLKQEIVKQEVDHIRTTHPLDFIFGLGAAVGFFIGFVVVYQILYTEVTNLLPQFATLKAMGFSDGYLLKIVLSQSAILSILGYFPGFFMALGIYQLATTAIQMPFEMTWSRAIFVFLATLTMCGLSGMVAIRKAWTADPADVF
ncbi:DevC protein [Pirellula staleyi DSM 6068]|uniref:DevC protein n=1 Tax=Pirellula staleyi (strain ATCC 27377 / DSM 6068 / ICPB 4128) TaxID=530564 RepID=D2QWF3_PIRSD|nr:ABC transporter permease DevC [Pirellula staleyi]ADB17756.1 DevC protein [Pirellula staleyi DSM 6068]